MKDGPINLSITKAKKATPNLQPLTVLILGASHNPRLRNCGAKACLVMPDSRCLLHHQLEIIKRYNPTEIYMTVGYDADRVIERRFDVRLIENQKYEETGEANDLRLFFNLCKAERLLILSGDLYLKLAIIHETPYNGSWSIGTYGTDNKEEVGFSWENERITDFSYSFNTKFSGFTLLEQNELELMRRNLGRDSSKFAVWEILETIVKKGANIRPIKVTNKVLKLNGIRDLNVLKNNFLC